jgi:hypothetical protein
MIPMIGSRILSAATAGCVLAGATAQAEPLRWKLARDETVCVTFDQKSSTTSSLGKPPIKLTSEMSIEMLWTVEDVSATGDVRIQQSFERFTAKIAAAGAAPVEFDSASKDEPKPAARSIAASIRPLLGKPFSVAMTSRGEISEVKLSPQLSAALDQFVVDDQVRSLFSTSGIRQTLQQAFPVLPQHAVSKGDSWTSETKFASPFGPLDLRSTFQLEEDVTQNGVAIKRITATGQVKYLRQIDDAQTPMIINRHATTGEYFFDPQAGRLIHSSVTQEIISRNRVGTGQLEIQTNSTMSVRLEPVKDKPGSE